MSEFCWNELLTTDIRKAESFYISLFGWTVTKHDMGEFEYTMFMNGDKPIGGMMQMPQDKEGVPSHWMSYVSVSDVDASVNKAKSLGAEIIMPKTQAGNFGYFALLKDPTGAYFSLWQAIPAA